jgi:choline kinase
MRQAVILAAGVGSRLRPLTDQTPKCLLEIGGRSLLDRLLDQLAGAGIQRAAIVTGHLEERIAGHLKAKKSALEVVLVPNPRYLSTNNAASLFVAKDALAGFGGFVLCDGDVVLRGNPIQTLVAEPGCALIIEQKGRMGAEEMKVVVSGGRVLRLSKELDPAECLGESIGIQKIGDEAISQLWEELSRMMHGGREGAYYEEVFQRLIDQGVPFRAVPIGPGAWTEIDDLADLEDARAQFADA